jgi:hypothetical protein
MSEAHECAAREIAEYADLAIKTGDLLVIDWDPPEGDGPRVTANYIFENSPIKHLTRVVDRLEERLHASAH